MNPNLTSIQLTPNEYQLYARHLILPQIQVNGQKRLKEAKILFIGAGGLASGSLLYLAAAGVGNIGIVDYDIIEISNLQRQIIFDTEQIGTYKTSASKEKIDRLNPQCRINTYTVKLTLSNAYALIQRYDIVIDGTDNFEVRHIISNTCKVLHRIHIYGAIFEWQGQTSVFNYRGGPTYADIYPLVSTNQNTQCSHGGVMGVTPGMISMIQATEAIKIITGVGCILSGKLLVYDALAMTFKKVKIKTSNQYSETSPLIREDIALSMFRYHNHLISISLLKVLIEKNEDMVYMVDIRSEIEYHLSHLRGAINLPLSFLKKLENINILRAASQGKYLTLFCNGKARSRIASKILSNYGIRHWQIDYS
jgi:sulfur-carrier protein adenylyltransferase/sulfurtransferase